MVEAEHEIVGPLCIYPNTRPTHGDRNTFCVLKSKEVRPVVFKKVETSSLKEEMSKV